MLKLLVYRRTGGLSTEKVLAILLGVVFGILRRFGVDLPVPPEGLAEALAQTWEIWSPLILAALYWWQRERRDKAAANDRRPTLSPGLK